MPREVVTYFKSDGAGPRDSWLSRVDMHRDHRGTGLSVPSPGTPPEAHSVRKAVPGPCTLAAAPRPSCSDRPLSQIRSSTPVSYIRAVERVDEGAFQLPHVMQVVTQDDAGTLHTTYLQCKVKHHKAGGLTASPGSHLRP